MKLRPPPRTRVLGNPVLLVIVSMVICLRGLLAVPAPDVLCTLEQPDGATLQARARGDEHYHWYETESGYPIGFNEPTKEWVFLDPDGAGIGNGKQLTRLRADGQPPDGGPWSPSPDAETWQKIETKMAGEANIPFVPLPKDQGILPRDPSVKPKESSLFEPKLPTSGQGRIAAFCVRYADSPPLGTETSVSTFQNRMFTQTTTHTTLTDLYWDMSYQTFRVTGGAAGVTGWYTVPNPRSFYGGNDAQGEDKNPGGLVVDAVTLAEGNGFNFGPYDTNNDGYVDCVMIIARGLGEENVQKGNEDAIWAKQGTTTDPVQTNDLNALGVPVKVSRYIIVNELMQESGSTHPQEMGVMAHEYGHALGLPDLYDRKDLGDKKKSKSQGLGDWSLMASGSWNAKTNQGDCPAWMDAWCRMKMGWATIQRLTTNVGSAVIPNAQNSPLVYRLWTNGNLGHQYFLVENRKNENFDSRLPGGGILIYHVDDDVGVDQNDNEWYYMPGVAARTNKGHYLVALEQADGQFNLERTSSGASNQGDVGDPWAKGKEFRSDTLPSSRKYNAAGTTGEGDESYVAVKNISDPNGSGDLTADLFVLGGDADLPIVAFTYPDVDGGVYQHMEQFQGTAFDSSSVQHIYVYLREDKPGGRYWHFNGGSGFWENEFHDYQKGEATGTGGLNWGRNMDDSALTDGNYEASVYGVDTRGVSGPVARIKFRIQRDMTAPDITINNPTTGDPPLPLSAVPTITGTATDNTAVREKRFALFSRELGQWYNWNSGPNGAFDSASFSFATHVKFIINGDTSWSVPLPATLLNGSYEFHAQSVDTTDIASDWKNVSFVLRVTPQVAFTAPVHSSFVAAFPALQGTAQAGAGATLLSNRVNISIVRNGQWWDGDSWSPSTTEVHASVNSGEWNYPGTSPDLVAQLPPDDGFYEVAVTVTDSLSRTSLPVDGGLAGNNALAFTVDSVPPSLEISALASPVITSPPVSSSMFNGTASDSSGTPTVRLYLKRLADGKYWSGVNWFDTPTQAIMPAAFQTGADGGVPTAWVCAVAFPRLGIRDGNMKNGSYEMTAMARDAAGNETTATSAFSVDWNPVWMRPQDTLAQIQPDQMAPVSSGTVGSSVYQSYSPRFPTGDEFRTFVPTTFGLDGTGNTYVISRSNGAFGSSDGSAGSGIYQRLGAGGWRRERQVTATPGPLGLIYEESWGTGTSSVIPDAEGYGRCDFVHGAVDAAGNTYAVYTLRQTNFITLYVTGALVVKFDPLGNLLWRNMIDTSSAVQRILPTPDGGAWLVLANAYLQSIEYGFSMTEVRKVSSSGSVGPVAVHGQLDGGDYDPAVWATHLFSEVDASGNIFHAVTEDTIGGTGAIQVLYKHDATGAQLAKLEVDPGETPEQWQTMKTDAAGNVYIASMFDVSETDRRICLTRYNSSLQLQWRAFGPPHSMGYNWNTAWMPLMQITSHGITLSYGSPGQGYYSEFPYEHGEFARFSASGDLLWTRGIKGDQATVLHGDAIHSFQVDNAGNVLFLAALNEPTNFGAYHYGKLTAAGDLQFIRPAPAFAFYLDGNDFTKLYQGTQLLVLNQTSSSGTPPDDLYQITLFDNPANQLVPVTLDSNDPADLLVLEGTASQLRVINRGSAASYQWRKKDNLGMPQNIPGATLDRLIFATTASTDAGEYSVVVTNAVDSATSRTATVTVLTQVPLDIALDTPGRTWTTGGTRAWAGFGTSPSHDGVDAAMPVNVGQGDSAWIETTVTGPGNVSFWWKSSTPGHSDFFDFYVDGDPVNFISGDQDWIFFQYNVGAGEHTLRWSFSKSSAYTVGTQNTVFLDQVVITGTTSVPLAEALDATGLTWTTSPGGLAWSGVVSPSHDGVDSGVSGTTGNNQQSYVETTVTGPGTLTFWWKVSSEPTFDKLAFTINGAPSGSIDGTVDWQQQTRTIPAGPQTLRWSYNKDVFGISGFDKAWLDQVVYTPDGAAPHISVEQPENHVLVNLNTSVDFGTALPGGSTVRTFTIRNTGSAPLSSIVITTSGGPSAALFVPGSLTPADPIAPNGTATFSVTFSPLVEGSRGAALQIASNDLSASPFQIGLYGSGGISVANWRQSYFGTGSNTGDAADEADPDGDGSNNLLEFATGGSPIAANKATQYAETPAAGFVSYLYTRNKLAMAELTFTVEWNDVLATTGWSSAGVTETILSDDGVTQQVKALVPTGGNDHRFVHLKVTR